MITKRLYRKRFGKVRSRVFSRKRFPAGSRYLRIRYPLGCLIDTAFKWRNLWHRAEIIKEAPVLGLPPMPY